MPQANFQNFKISNVKLMKPLFKLIHILTQAITYLFAEIIIKSILYRQKIKHMGNTPNKKEIEKQIEDEYKSVRKYYDEVYGDVTIVESRDTLQTYALIERVVETSFDFGKKIQELNETQDILKIVRIYCRNTDMCSQSKAYHILVEYQQNSLEKQLLKRFQEHRHFQREEVLRIMYQIVNIVISLRKTQRPQKIPLHNKLFALTKTFDVKVLNPLLVENKEGEVFQLSTSEDPDRRFIFVSPQVMNVLSQNQRSQAQFQQIQQNSQVWTIGMCFIQILLLTDATVIYDFKSKCIQFQRIKQMLVMVSNIYGDDIEKIVGSMLSQNSKNRSKLSDVRNKLIQVGGISLTSRKSSVCSPSRKQSLSLASKFVSRRESN